MIHDWRLRIHEAGGPNKPVMQPLYIDLAEDPKSSPQAIHLGFRSGVDCLRTYLQTLEKIGVNHVAFNLRFNRANIEDTMQRLADHLLPDFSG